MSRMSWLAIQRRLLEDNIQQWRRGFQHNTPFYTKSSERLRGAEMIYNLHPIACTNCSASIGVILDYVCAKHSTEEDEKNCECERIFLCSLKCTLEYGDKRKLEIEDRS